MILILLKKNLEFCLRVTHSDTIYVQIRICQVENSWQLEDLQIELDMRRKALVYP